MDSGNALIKIEGKALEKFIEVVSKGIGTLYRPRQIRKEADAQAYAAKVIGRAKAEAEAESRIIEIETEERIRKRLAAKEMRRQENIDTVVEIAANDLDISSVSEKNVDEDWATRFFDIVQDVSKDEMRVLWGRILAREVEKPSSFSMRTLETLRNLSVFEAKTFERVAPFVMRNGDGFIFNDQSTLEMMGIHYNDLALLTECGIMQAGDFVTKSFSSNPEKDIVSAIVYGKYAVVLTIRKASPPLGFPVIILSQVGRELFGLLEPVVNMEYLISFADYVKKQSANVTLQYAELISKENGQIHYVPPLVSL